jgi:hypothetical protein
VIVDANGREVIALPNDVHENHIAQLITDLLDLVNKSQGEEVEEETSSEIDIQPSTIEPPVIDDDHVPF